MKAIFETSEALRENGMVREDQPDTYEIEVTEFVQLTYQHFRVGPEGDFFAFYDDQSGCWVLDKRQAGDQVWKFSDVVITA